MDIIIWTKFDKEPITLYVADSRAAWKFKERVSSSKLNYVSIHGADGFHMIRCEHIVRVHIPHDPVEEEGTDDNGTV